MGSVCCVAVKDRKVPPPSSSSSSGVAPRACSPQWSFRRDNRRRVADEIEGSPYYSLESRGISLDKMSLGSERGTLSKGGGETLPLDGPLGTSASQKPATPELGSNLMAPPSSDSSLASHDPMEVKNLVDSPSRRARRSPGHQLYRQQYLATGSHDASSEGGWSLNTFSELVAYSQRERWSFDSEHLGSSRRKLSGGGSRFSLSPSVVFDQQTCGACSKLPTERSSVASFDLSIAAVLACGHVYHAECLVCFSVTYGDNI